jgi:signal transduction histidine kinase
MTLIPRRLQARTAVVIALAFFVFLSLFFATTYLSIRGSLLARSDGEADDELVQIAAALKLGLSTDSLTHLLSAYRSIGESELRFVLFERQRNGFHNLSGKQAEALPHDVEEQIKQHPDEPASYSTSEGDMRLISIVRGNFIIGASYHILLLEEAEDSIIQVFAYYLAAGLLVGILGGLFLSRYLIGPIRSLASAARTILHRPEQAPARLPVSETIEEVADLAHSINELLDARERALELQRNFAADAAHELRTPLTVLKGEIEVELRLMEPNSPQAEILRSNLEEIDRLISTVQDLLELAEIEAEGEQGAVPSECSILSAINYAADRLLPLAMARETSIIVPNEDVIIAAQEKRITRLIYNLLLNAVQHSGVASQIEVRLLLTDHGCTLEIEDHGKGISIERIEHLFERFHPTGGGFSEKHGGAGLGLAIVKSIADHYGFTLAVRSSPGAGTTVSLHFPASTILG